MSLKFYKNFTKIERQKRIQNNSKYDSYVVVLYETIKIGGSYKLGHTLLTHGGHIKWATRGPVYMT